MLIYAGDKGVPRNELLNILYGHGECVNPAGDLRMVVSRLRKRLRDYGILDYADIVTSGGVYRWKGNGLEVRLDVREFEETAAISCPYCPGKNGWHTSRRIFARCILTVCAKRRTD